MVLKIIASGVLITLPTIASAQAGPVATKSSNQITCELTGDCDAFNQELATEDRKESRGLRVDLPGAPARKVLPPAPGYAAPRAPAPVASGQRTYVATPAVTRAAPGRSTLSINFASGSAEILAGSRAQAQALVDALKSPAAAGKRFIVAGHTDSVGGREYNLELSRRRAEALTSFLVENGVERSRLQPEGYGFDKPVPGLSARAAANRRVEIVKVD